MPLAPLDPPPAPAAASPALDGGVGLDPLLDGGAGSRARASTAGAEFWKLACGRRDANLTGVVLEIAADHFPGADAAATARTVDDWLAGRAAEVRGRVAGAESDRAALEALADVLCGEHGLCGGDAAFGDPHGSFLHRVVETGTGLPIALSLIYLDVAARVGLPLAGVSSPHHFLCRLDPADGGPPLFCDPYHGGRVLTEDEAVEFLMGRCDLAPAEIADSLHPAAPRAVTIRVLNNLKALFVRTGDWASAWPVQHRLAALCPAEYRERRDLALIALHAGRPGQALDLLDALLPTAPPEEAPALKRHRDRAVGQVSRWN